MSHASNVSQENLWNNWLGEWKPPPYFSKTILHHIKHSVDGMLSTGFIGTLTDIQRESLQERDHRKDYQVNAVYVSSTVILYGRIHDQQEKTFTVFVDYRTYEVSLVSVPVGYDPPDL